MARVWVYGNSPFYSSYALIKTIIPCQQLNRCGLRGPAFRVRGPIAYIYD